MAYTVVECKQCEGQGYEYICPCVAACEHDRYCRTCRGEGQHPQQVKQGTWEYAIAGACELLFPSKQAAEAYLGL